jgi:hypothetical protein
MSTAKRFLVFCPACRVRHVGIRIDGRVFVQCTTHSRDDIPCRSSDYWCRLARNPVTRRMELDLNSRVYVQPTQSPNYIATVLA